MKTFEFIIIASGLDPEAENFFDQFLDAGLDDATVSYQRGLIIVDVAREASSIDEAIASAVENVKEAGATVERIEPDPYVNLSDIAERAGVTRAAVSQYSTGARREDFPLPVARVATTPPLWYWSDVAVWFYRHDRLERDAAVEALAVKAANSVIRASHFGRLSKSAWRPKRWRPASSPAKKTAPSCYAHRACRRYPDFWRRARRG
jgi:hypothetical protein